MVVVIVIVTAIVIVTVTAIVIVTTLDMPDHTPLPLQHTPLTTNISLH